MCAGSLGPVMDADADDVGELTVSRITLARGANR